MKTLLSVAAGCALAATALAGEKPQFTLGIQMYTFKDRTLVESVELAKKLGFQAMELTGCQKMGGALGDETTSSNLSAEKRKALKAYLDGCGLKAMSYGVTGAGDEAGWRKEFQFVKDIGLSMMIVEPDVNALPLLDKLAAEYKIRVHIHNHTRGGSPWWSPIFMAGHVANCSEWIGAGADTGHWIPAGVDPVMGIRYLKSTRIFALHLVDADEKGHPQPYGKGKGHIKEMLDLLKPVAMKSPILLTCEYEEWTPETLPKIEACVKWFNAWMAAQ
ncbi:MAG: sugar phosphate isomerase/epimerase [Kiritimatiellae bacterium]|nr:sugar phosphate isomerase/epimerase [Kiritimatiellia bacterium]